MQTIAFKYASRLNEGSSTVVSWRQEEGSVDERKLIVDGQRAAAGDARKAADTSGTETAHQQSTNVVVAMRSVVIQSDVVGVLGRSTDRFERCQVGAVLEDITACPWRRRPTLLRGCYWRRARSISNRRSKTSGAVRFRLR